MSKDRFVAYLLVGLTLLAVLGVSMLILSNRHPEVFPTRTKDVSGSKSATRQPPKETTYDFTTMLPDTPPAASSVKPTLPSQTIPPVHTSRSSYRTEPMDNRPSTVRLTTTTRTPQHFVPSKGSTIRTQPPISYVTSKQSGSAETAASGQPAYFNTQASNTGATSDIQGQDILNEQTPTQTVQQQRLLAQRLAAMSAGVDKAILEAMRGLSTRDQNIEKNTYGQAADTTQQASAQATANGRIMQQLAQQALQIVGDIRRNYGDRAAGKASQLMNGFQQEMARLLNSNLSPEEKMIQAQEINNKYNAKLQNLNKNEAKSKMQEHLQNENTEYINKISAEYGSEVANLVTPILQKYAQQRLTNWTTPQNEADAIAKETALQQQMYKEITTLLEQKGYRGDITPVLNKPVIEQIKKQSEDRSPIFRQNQEAKAAREAAWKQESTPIVESFAGLGDEAKQEAQRLTDQLQADRSNLYAQAAQEGWTKNKLAQKDMELVNAFNEKSQQLHDNTLAKQSDAWYEKQFQSMPEDVKKQLRPLWHQANIEKAKLNRELMSEAQRKQKEQQIDAQLQQNMQKIAQQYQDQSN